MTILSPAAARQELQLAETELARLRVEHAGREAAVQARIDQLCASASNPRAVALERTIARARQLLKAPRNNWESAGYVAPVDGFYVLLTTAEFDGQLRAWCQLRRHNSSAADHLKWTAPLEDFNGERAAFTSVLARCIIDLEIQLAQLDEVE